MANSETAAKCESEDNFDGEWLREATFMEEEMEEVYLTGHRLWYQLDLSSKLPLQEDHVRRALNHFYRKLPNMKIAYGIRNGKLWLKRATNRNVDFEFLQDQTMKEVRTLMHSYSFNRETGPTICARLLQAIDKDMEDLEPTFPHKYHLLFGIRHSLTDGTSTNTMMGFFITLLNDVISNTFVDDSQYFGNFESGDQTMTLIQEKIVLIESDSNLKHQLQREFEFKKENKPIILKLPLKSKSKWETDTIEKVLDRITTSQFLLKCRQEKVTVNTIMSALINTAIVGVLAEEGIEQKSYMLQNFHSVNLRRYWECQNPNALGCHIGFPLIVNVNTPRDVYHHFWEYAKPLNSIMREDVLSGKILLFEAYKILTKPDISHQEDQSLTYRPYEGDYVTSSMGDVTDKITEEGTHVRVTNVLRSTACHGTEFPIVVNYHTFRGRLTISFDYNTEILDGTLVKRILSLTVESLKGIMI